MMLLNRDLVSSAKYCLVGVFSNIVKDCPEIRNLPKKFRECGPRTNERYNRSQLTVCVLA